MSLPSNNLYEFGEFRIDLAERTLWHREKPVPLAPKVIETLCVLIENRGRLMSKDELMREIWADTFVEERNLTQNIFTLRKVLGETETRKFIETVPRRGYRFVAEVVPVSSREETLSVSHSKHMRVAAEGFVSRNELAETVKEIARSLVQENAAETIEPKRTEARKKAFFALPLSVAALTAVVLPLIMLGAAVWLWQNDYINLRKTTSAETPARPLLEFERLTDSGKAFFPVVSPDKQFIAYVFVEKGKYSIELSNIATKSKLVVVAPTEKEIGRVQFSPDGNHLFYRQEEGKGKSGVAFQIPIFGGTPRLIVRGVNSDAALSPDGERLAFIRFMPEIGGQQLVVCRSRDGSDERVVSTRTGNESFIVWGYKPTWSLDGKKVFVGLLAEPTPENADARGEGFGLMNVEDGAFEPLKTPEWNDFIQAEWMPDGKSILYLAKEKANETFQIWQVAYPGGEGRRVTNDSHDYRYLALAPDAEFILTTQERTYFNLWLIPAGNPGEARQLTFSSELIHGRSGITWTPDGLELVYTLVENNVDTNLWRINVETLEKRQITFDRERLNIYPNVTPDGKSVIFASNRENGMHIWQADLDGSNLRQVTFGVGERGPTLSPDGKWLIYPTPAVNIDTLWKKSLTNEAEPPVKLLSGAAGSNSISPDGRTLVVCYKITGENGKLEYKYGLMPFAPTAMPEDLGFNPYFGAIAWKKDSSGFYYVKDLGMNLNNIWFYDIRTKAHRQITNFEDRMYKLALSPDGGTLATARGATVSNIFRISGF